MEARSERNQGHSLRSTSRLQNTQRGQRNQVELFLAPFAASGTVAPAFVDSEWDNQRGAAGGIATGAVSAEPRG